MNIDPYVMQLAQMVSQMTGLDTYVVLAQWNAEEGVGSADWPGYNPAGITPGNSAVDALGTGGTTSGGFVVFPTPAAGAQGYATLINTDPNYSGIRAAIRTGNPTDQLNAIIQSPWDAGHYGGDGSNLYASYRAVSGANIQTPSGLMNAVNGADSSSTPNGAIDNVTIPSTNYGIVANSQRYGNVLYGRRYRVIVSNANGVALDVSQLRCTFNIQKTILATPNLSTVTIYNLNADTENTIIQEGNRVVVEAGYEGQQYGLIFDGDIVQPIRDKEDAVTYRLTLSSQDGDRFYAYGFVGFSLLKGQTARTQIGSIASQAKIPSQLGSISDGLSDTALTRGKVLFGMAKDYLRQIAKSQNATYYMEDGKLNIIKPTDLPNDEILDLSPASGLIDTPSQNQNGVTFKCMLNPIIKINSFVHIDNSLIREQTYQQGQVIRNLDNDGIYRVISVNYVGDTRGDNWYVECTAVSQAGGTLPSLMQNPNSNPY